MKFVLRHKKTGRYYHSPGKWVRRADNALAFENAHAAQEFCRRKHLLEVQPVQRLAPYLMSLIGKRRQSVWESWVSERSGHRAPEPISKFNRN